MIGWFKRKKKKPEETEAPERDERMEDGAPEEREPESPLAAEPETEAVSSGEAESAPESEALEEAPEARLEEPRAETGQEEPGSEESLEDEEDLDQITEPEEKKAGFFRRLRARLQKTRSQFATRLDRIFLGRKTIDQDLLDELEEVLITSDLGVHTTQVLLSRITEKIQRKELSDPAKLREQLREEIRNILTVPAPPLDLRREHPLVMMVIGVNGVGKTTTIGKLTNQFKREGLTVMLAAGDTFRAAAIEQLTIWGERNEVPVIRQKSGSDPSAVAFDAMDAAVKRDVDVLILDTAGRMHTKVNLMEELKKVQRVVTKKIASAPHEVLLVLDASTGQNALSQARLFKSDIGITGLVLTKLDGTAKGGIVVGICDELKVPVRYIGIGERIDDLRPFDPEEFTRALF